MTTILKKKSDFFDFCVNAGNFGESGNFYGCIVAEISEALIKAHGLFLVFTGAFKVELRRCRVRKTACI